MKNLKIVNLYLTIACSKLIVASLYKSSPVASWDSKVSIECTLKKSRRESFDYYIFGHATISMYSFSTTKL